MRRRRRTRAQDEKLAELLPGIAEKYTFAEGAGGRLLALLLSQRLCNEYGRLSAEHVCCRLRESLTHAEPGGTRLREACATVWCSASVCCHATRTFS
jgi:hypothetical protein